VRLSTTFNHVGCNVLDVNDHGIRNSSPPRFKYSMTIHRVNWYYRRTGTEDGAISSPHGITSQKI
jgi:hypothetical protein